MSYISTSDVPQVYVRNVLRAIAYLQKGDTTFIPADAIIQKVILQMSRSRKLGTVRDYVMKALASLTHLGLLSRSPSTDNGFYQIPVDYGDNFLPRKIKNKNCKRNRARNFKSKANNDTNRKLRKTRGKRSFKAKFRPCNNGACPIMCTDCRSNVMSCVKAYMAIEKGCGMEKEEIKKVQENCKAATPEAPTMCTGYDFNSPIDIIAENDASLEKSKL